MRRLLALAPLLLVAAATVAAVAQEAPERRILSGEEGAAYAGVGRLNIAGRRFCTATLVEPSVVATAAHCLYHPRTGARVPVSELRFVAGFRRGVAGEEHGPRRRVAPEVRLGERDRKGGVPIDRDPVPRPVDGGAKGLVDDALDARIGAEVDAEVRAAIERAEARMQAVRPLDMFDNVYGDVPAEVEAQRQEFAREVGEDARTT